ncbi:MAG: oligosaccharide flippase family protein [Pseudomonadota bacterium]
MTVRKSLALATVSNYVTMLISFGAMLIIARQLTPTEFGIYSISLASTGFLNALREGGVNAYIIQHQSDDLDVLQAAFTAATFLSLTSALILLIMAPLAGDFFNAPEVTSILWIIMASFLAYPFVATVFATLQREMRFHTILIMEVTVSLVQSFVALSLVFLGFGVYSLAIAVTTSSFVRAVFCLAVVPDLKRFRIRFTGVLAVLSFSVIATGSLILREVKDGAFAIIAGRLIGPAPVGLADRSLSIIRLYDKVIAGIYPVVLPAFAELRRSGADSVEPLLKGQAMLNLTAMGVYGFLMIAAEPVLIFLYGGQWRDAAAFVPPMMLAALFGSAFERLATPIYIAHGRVDIVLKIQSFLAPVTVFALIIAAPFGVMPALWALVGTSILGALADLFFLPTLIDVTRKALIRAFANAILVVLPAIIVGVLAAQFAEHWRLGTFPYLVCVGLPYLLAFMTSAFFLKHPIADEVKRWRHA